MEYFIPYRNGGGTRVDWDFQSIIHCFTWHSSQDGYAQAMTLGSHSKRKHIRMHRLLLNFPDEDVDHINGIRNDNRLSNLREATRQENAMNRKCHRDGFSYQFTYDKRLKRYRVYRFENGKSKYVCLVNNKEDFEGAD